ncbi:uncharacterized protein LOC126744324 isoform X2 [Anthonomus grandis grandis]|uniref:uncharacterized protein LOC126744324 isoform X2 n=1 Tax=Anthonomus grandis grandis TaxID=2921223 RepID=UPI002166B5D9|nr:uncharacterized protein LOC126744324 isoform X2 [Anthonomus grandis grandis]
MEIKSLVALVVLFSVFKSGRALHCYTCNVSTSTLDENGCSGIGSLKGCAGGSVCLAATYENVHESPPELCIDNSDGNEESNVILQQLSMKPKRQKSMHERQQKLAMHFQDILNFANTDQKLDLLKEFSILSCPP